jgi:outer membrane receptor for ferrienterochelin and colicins
LFEFNNLNLGLEVFGGVKNIFNAYQNDFDSGKNRDSNYVYGSGAPRTFFIGLRMKTL